MREYIITLHIAIPEDGKYDIKDFESFLTWTSANRPQEYSMEQADQQDREYDAFVAGMRKSHVVGYIEATRVGQDISAALEDHKRSLNT